MNLWDILILLAVAGIAAAAFRGRKKGASCCSSWSGGSLTPGGNCTSCASCSACMAGKECGRADRNSAAAEPGGRPGES